MRLTAFTDFTLRTLIYLAGHRGRLSTIQEIADCHAISKSHLTKVVYQLGRAGLVRTVRGHNGGIELAREPREINAGAVVRAAEGDFFMAACFNAARQACPYAPSCGLQSLLGRATAAYLAELDGATLADLVGAVESGGGAG